MTRWAKDAALAELGALVAESELALDAIGFESLPLVHTPHHLQVHLRDGHPCRADTELQRTPYDGRFLVGGR